jgi:uncharacterized protein (TIGR02452 family)
LSQQKKSIIISVLEGDYLTSEKNRKRNFRAVLAQETLRIIEDGYYINSDGRMVSIADDVLYSRENSVFISVEAATQLERNFCAKGCSGYKELRNESTLSAILRLGGKENNMLGVLNFASAKNPGGGFLNGAVAQEESLAVASNLYNAQIAQPKYYTTNRTCKTMMYTNCAIWSPNVVFFRNDDGTLLPSPVKASVLTLPAVNYGQVLIKGEDTEIARTAMKQRMRIALAIFAEQGCSQVILGAYGCGVFRNDTQDVAVWWDELLREYGGYFRSVVFAVLSITFENYPPTRPINGLKLHPLTKGFKRGGRRAPTPLRPPNNQSGYRQ